MMKFVKSDDGERISVISDDGDVIAYIEKERFGIHGNWRGWRHCVFCDRLGKIIWVGVDETVVYPERVHVPWKSWSDLPPWFSNVKEFKAFYQRG